MAKKPNPFAVKMADKPKDCTSKGKPSKKK